MDDGICRRSGTTQSCKAMVKNPGISPNEKNIELSCFEEYVSALEDLIGATMESGKASPEYPRIQPALRSQPMEVLNDSMSLAKRREVGAFFTGQDLRRQLLDGSRQDRSAVSRWLDPACGAGDLLIAAAQQLPVQRDLPSTLARWKTRLFGLDTNPLFVRAAKARLVLLAIARGALMVADCAEELDTGFPGIRVGDSLLAGPEIFRKVTHVILNPPFGLVEAPINCPWGSGQVSKASLFVAKCLTSVPQGTLLNALLPEVLRSGSRYHQWREYIASLGRIIEVRPQGVFDGLVDIDVFSLRIVAGDCEDEPNAVWWDSAPLSPAHGKVGDHFKVRVGPVIPFRHPHQGPCLPYIHARLIPIWDSFDTAKAETRQFAGTAYTPPFVAVRRTSRPGRGFRAPGTLVLGNNPVAVENHLLVLQPKDGTVHACRALLSNLENPATNCWLDNRIRCRHLTVSALTELPWWSTGHDV